MLELDPLRARPRTAAANRRWKPIATLHSPIARWPSSSSAWLTIPTGFVKSTIQWPGAASRSASLGDVEDDRHGPERLREAAGAGRLLADRAEPRRERLVDEAGRLAADAELDDDEVGALEGRLEYAA